MNNTEPKCPSCNGELTQEDTTYSNMNSERASAGQHTGDIYFCDLCEEYYLDNFLDNKIQKWNY